MKEKNTASQIENGNKYLILKQVKVFRGNRRKS